MALLILRRWPGGAPVHQTLLWRLLDLAVRRERVRNAWDKQADRPVGDWWAPLQQLLQTLPVPVQAGAADRHLLVQAVLLEHGVNLDQTVLQACAPALSDPDLGGPDSLARAGRLATLRRWMQRHPALAGPAGAALAAAARDTAQALDDPHHWPLVDELVASTDDPDVLGEAVRRVSAHLHSLLSAGDERISATDYVWIQAHTVLQTLAACPATPDDALVAALPVTPPLFPADLVKARPPLEPECTAETLARTGFLHAVPAPHVPVQVAADEELAATGDPAAAIAGYLQYLPAASRAEANRLAVCLLRSRYADPTVLAALPAELVMHSPWQAALAAAMLTEACGQDRRRWQALDHAHRHDLTFGGLLAELREYTPAAPGAGLAGYRYCHACRLTTPYLWEDIAGDDPAARRRAEGRRGWMTCELCSHSAAPAPLLADDATHDCPTCGHAIAHPGSAAVLHCPACDSLFFAPDLPAELRPRIDGVLDKQQRTAEAVRQLADTIDEATRATPPAPTHPLHDLLDPRDFFPGQLRRSRPPRPALRAPEPQWLTSEPAGVQFRAALTTAIRADKPDRARAALLRYGLGRARRPLTTAEVASRLAITTGTVTQRVHSCLADIHATATTPAPARTAAARAAVIAAHLADQALGGIDLDDPQLGSRIATLLHTALPGLDTGTGVRLLLRLTGRHHELSQVHVTALTLTVDGTS